MADAEIHLPVLLRKPLRLRPLDHRPAIAERVDHCMSLCEVEDRRQVR